MPPYSQSPTSSPRSVAGVEAAEPSETVVGALDDSMNHILVPETVVSQLPPLPSRQESFLMAASTSPVLYDPQALINMESAVAQGYITLLCGGDDPSTQKKRLKENRIRRSAISAGFLAITQGNVVEACFGTFSQPQRQQPSQETTPESAGPKGQHGPQSNKKTIKLPKNRRSEKNNRRNSTSTVSSLSSEKTAMAIKSQARTMMHVKRIKALLADIAFDAYDDEEELSFCKLAVMTFMKAFEIVLRTNDAIHKLTVVTKCFLYNRILYNAHMNLQRTFRKLQESVMHYQNQQERAAAAIAATSSPPSPLSLKNKNAKLAASLPPTPTLDEEE